MHRLLDGWSRSASGPPSPGSPRRVAGFLIGRTVAAEIMMIDLVSQVFGRPTPSVEYWVHRRLPREVLEMPPGQILTALIKHQTREARGVAMPGNKAVIYKGPDVVAVEETGYPSFELKDNPGVNPANVGRKVHHGVILKVIATNICGSDQHMVRGRTTAPPGLVLGHEITGEVVETGRAGDRGVTRDSTPRISG